MGDFNVQQKDSELASMLLQGNIYALDDSFGPLCDLPPTRNKSSRRIDFGLSSKNLFPSNLNHDHGVADHLLVIYTFDSIFQFPHWAGPKRRQFLSDLSDSDIRSNFLSKWDFGRFSSSLLTSGTTEAYRMLSEVAEDALTRPQSCHQSCCPRSQPWRPAVKPRAHKACQQTESVLLRRLRRLHRKLHHAVQRPADNNLLFNCLHSFQLLKRQVPEFQSLNPDSPAVLFAVTETVCSRLETEEKQARIKAWQQRTHGSLAKQSAWLKRRCLSLSELDTMPPRHDHQFSAIHPAQVVDEQQTFWSSQWTQPFPVAASELQPLLASLSEFRPAPFQGEIHWSGSDLQKIAQEMSSKAMGPDDWPAAQLLRLPDDFWQALACLWQRVYDTGSIPEMWHFARIALLPKSDLEWRPLSIASVFWRIGTRHIVRRLRHWVQSWVSPHLFGAVPGRSVSHALIRILHAAESLTPVFVAQDLSKFFDSIRVQQACQVAQFLGAPPQLSNLLLAFYKNGQRLMSCAGTCAPDWFPVSRGLMQGCPLSPTVAVMIMQLWAWHVARPPNIDAVCFIDDRTFWCSQPDDSLLQAKVRSDEFDQAFNFSCRTQKCHVASATPAVAGVASQFQYPSSNKLQVLGVNITLSQQPTVELAKCSISNINLLLDLVHCVAITFRDRQRLIASLIISKLTWAAGIASLSDAQLHQIRKSVVRAFGGRTTLHDSPQVILLELLTWPLDPLFANEWAALRTFCNFVMRPPAWVQQCDPQFQNLSVLQFFPTTHEVLKNLHWHYDDVHHTISRLDHAGQQRTFAIGWDNPKVLMLWLTEHHRRQALAACRRIRQSLHRQHAGNTATGLDLPGVPNSAMCQFKGHCQVFFAPGADLRQRQSAQAAGTNFWSNTYGMQLQDDDPRMLCMCGLRVPSRPHLVWSCSHTAPDRENIPGPAHRVEERILAKVTPEFPAAPVEVDRNTHVNNILNAFTPTDDLPQVLHVAVDGSSKLDIGAWAIAFEHLPNAFVGGFCAEDQSPFRAEAEALLICLLVLFRLSQWLSFPSKVVILCDCKPVIQLTQSSLPKCALLAKTLAELLVQIKSGGINVQLHWVPAHGRSVPHWRPPASASEALCRKLNARADEAARNYVLCQLPRSARESWHHTVVQHAEWEVRVIAAAVAAGHRYRAHLAAAAGALPALVA